MLELVILKVGNRPDCQFSTNPQDKPSRPTQLTMLDFSMPTLNSIFPFLETVRPKSDPCWHIRRGRLLHHYESVWAVCNDKNQPNSIIFGDEERFKTVDICDKTHIVLCLVPRWWIISLRANKDSRSKDTGFDDKLREACLLLVSSRCPGYVLSRGGFLGTGEKERDVQ